MGDAGSDSLRRFALTIYGTADVSDACLLLQSRFDIDVNLLLFAAYVGAVRTKTLFPESFDIVRARTDPWHRDVVRPLRTVRQRLRAGPAPAPNPVTAVLRHEIKEIELQAELIELGELGELADLLDAPTAPGGAAERATAAMETVLRADFDGQLSSEDRAAIATIAAAAARNSSTG
jgi:uncharacterized protein (TIGR02444 family)